MATDTNRRDSDSDSDTFDYLGKGSMPDEESRRGSDSSTDSCDELQKKDVERLGRMRPAEFSTTLHEAIFVCVIVLSLMMSEYFTSGFTIILPTLGRVFQVKDGDRTWPTAAPNLATAAFLLPGARLCDQYGSRRIFLFGHVWLFIWSVINGFCLDIVTIVVCRAMQGIGLAAFLPAGLAILGRIYRPGPRKNLIYCVYGAFACIGFYFGILMAAVATQYIDWRWYFWIGAILEVFVLVVGFVSIPRLKDANPDMKMDWWGLVTIVPGVTLVVFAFSDGCNAPNGWRTPYILVTLGLGCLSLLAAVYTQGWVSAQPLLPIGIFKPKYIKRLMGGLFCYYGVFSLFLFYSSLYIENIIHADPMQTALWYLPLALGGIILSLAGGKVLHMISGYVLMMISGIAFIVCVLLFALMPSVSEDQNPAYATKEFWAYIFPAMCCGTLGMDIMFNVTNVFFTTALPKRDQATAGGVVNSLMCLGIAFWLGVTDVAISTAKQIQDTPMKLLKQYRISFWTAVALSVLAFCLIVTVRTGSAVAEITADEKEELDKDAQDAIEEMKASGQE